MAKYLALIFLIIAAWFGYQAWQQPTEYHSQSYVFGTMVEIKIVGMEKNKARAISDQVLSQFQSLQERLHPWKPVSKDHLSELQQLNQAFANGEAVKVSPDLVKMLQESTAFSVKSDGLFNPTIGHLIQFWGFQRDEFTPVQIDQEKIATLVSEHPKMTDIEIAGSAVSTKKPAVNVDLGGYAKGYALDVAYQFLKTHQVKNALVNIGGNIIALGKNGDRPWRVGIQHPRQPSAIATIDLPDGWAIGTSGDYQRYFELNGQRYCHLIDPRTGYPAQHTQAVTVLVPSQPAGNPQAGALSDMASKPIFIESAAQKAAMVKKLGLQYVMVIDAKAKVFVTPEMQQKLHWVTSDVVTTTLQ